MAERRKPTDPGADTLDKPQLYVGDREDELIAHVLGQHLLRHIASDVHV